MIYEAKKMAMSATGGLLIAVLIISSVVLTDIQPTTGAKGLLIINVKDDPAKLEELWINISAVKVHRAGEGNETWTDIPVIATDPFDLLLLEEVSTVLAAGELPVGNYTEIRFRIANAWANTTENSHQPLDIVANGWMMVKIHFTIEETPVTSVLIDIEVNEQPILSSGKLHPVVKATVDYVE